MRKVLQGLKKSVVLPNRVYQRPIQYYRASNFVNTFPKYLSSEAKTGKSAEEETATNEAEAEVASEEVAESTETVESERVKQLESDLKDMKDTYLRELAETENLRKRNLKEVENTRTYAIQSFAKQLLEVNDNLKRALASVPEGEVSKPDVNPHFVSLFEGVEMTQKGLTKVFEKNKLVEYGAIGDTFDPNIHNAMFNMSDPEKAKGTIGQVVNTGFKFGERVLRPADVGTFN